MNKLFFLADFFFLLIYLNLHPVTFPSQQGKLKISQINNSFTDSDQSSLSLSLSLFLLAFFKLSVLSFFSLCHSFFHFFIFSFSIFLFYFFFLSYSLYSFRFFLHFFLSLFVSLSVFHFSTLLFSILFAHAYFLFNLTPIFKISHII